MCRRSPIHDSITRLLLVGVLCLVSCTQTPSERLNTAASLSGTGRFAEAERMLASLLDEEPGNLKASHEYARVLLNRGMFRRADSVLGLLKHHSPHTLLLAARTSLGLGQVDRAQSFLRQVVDTAFTDTTLLAEAYHISGLVEFTNGKYDLALLNQLQSLYLARTHGNVQCEADAMRQIGVLLWYRGHLDSALHGYYQPALELYKKLGERVGEATTLSNIGLIHGTREDWRTNLQHQLTALELRRTIGDLKGLVDSYYFLSSFIPHSDYGREFAYSFLKKSYDLAQQIGYVWGAEVAYRGLRDIEFASTLHSDEQHLDTDTLFKSSAEASLTKMARRAVQLKKLKRWEESAVVYEQVIMMLDSIKYRTGQEANLLNYAEVLSTLGRHTQAETMALRALRYILTIDRRQGELEAELTIASIRLAAGRRGDALARLERICRSLDSAYLATLSTTHPVIAFETAAAEAHLMRGRGYAILIETLAHEGDADRLLSAMERERRLPFWGRRDETAGESGLSNLVQMIREYEQGGVSREEHRTLQTRIGEMYQKMLSQHYRLSSASANLPSPSSVTLGKLQTVLSSNQVFVSFYVADSTITMLAIRKKRAEIYQHRIPLDHVQSVIDILGESIARGRDNHQDSLWKGPARFLDSLLIRPLITTGMLQNGNDLLLSPHRGLHLISFATLLSRQGVVLIDRVSICYAPSATHLEHSLHNVRIRPTSLLVFAPDDETLPFVREEIAAIPTGLFQTRRTLSAGNATSSDFLKESPSVHGIHIASHGTINALYPLYSTIACEDGSLELHEILGTRLNAHYVLLAACAAGRTMGTSSRIPDGHDMVSFPRAFITAGAATVIAPLWLVEDKATASLVKSFYHHCALATSGRTEWAPGLLGKALNQAQRDLKTQDSYQHPFFWSAFTVTGRP